MCAVRCASTDRQYPSSGFCKVKPNNMVKTKKQSREERLRKKRLAEKRRYDRIKNDENLWKEKQEKNRQSYIRRKEEKKQLSIGEMNPRQQRLQRKKWRKNFKAYYLRKKQERRTANLLKEYTPPESPVISDLEQLPLQDPLEQLPLQDPLKIRFPSPPALNPNKISVITSSPASRNLRSVTGNSRANFNFDLTQNQKNLRSPSCASTASSQNLRRLRYKKDKQIKQLKQIIDKLKRKNHSFQKQIQRINNKEPKKVQLSYVPEIKRIVRKTNKAMSNTRMPEQLKKDVESFYEDDENSRLCSGKKEFIVRNKIRKQKRFLNDSILNLHQKFLKISKFTISYAAFCKLRPFWVLSPDSRARDTCLCKLHTNMDLIVQGLFQNKIIAVKTSQDLLRLICCNVYDVNCLQRKCIVCKDKVVPYQEFDNSTEVLFWQWETKQEIVQSSRKKIRMTEKTKIKMEPLKCIKKLDNLLDQYFLHCANIVSQQKAFKDLKEFLLDDECIIHIDFSENYSVKCNEEVQSYHFGGSRKQITLHTSVIYFLNSNQKQHISFCTISECLRHDISAVWAHIIPILEYIATVKTNIRTLHFISDSPSSQYRNKKIFHMIACLHIYLSSVKTVTWNYSEAGHGKGAPDGVGAVLKRTADRAVSQGQDITQLDDFLKIMDDNLKSIKLKTVSEYDVYEKDLLFPQTLKNFIGCMKMHQIVWNIDYDVMAVRKLSCTENICLYKPVECMHDKHLGFFFLDGNNDNYVTPLSDSPRILREISASFWTSGTINNSNIIRENNTQVSKREMQKEKEIEREIDEENDEITQKNQESTRYDHEVKKIEKNNSKQNEYLGKNRHIIKKSKKGKGIGKKSKVNSEAIINDATNQQNKNTNESKSYCTMKVGDSKYSKLTYQEINKYRRVITAKQNLRETSKFTTKYTEEGEEEQEKTMNKSIVDLDNLSFSKDGNKDFNIDLNNINPYVLDDDDDEDFNIF